MPQFLQDRHRPHLLAFLVAAVFANSFLGVFVFDEYTSITKNDTIRHLWPLDCMFKYPNDTRPVIGLTFALNYAIHGTHFWSYHVVNLVIHLIAALTLYAVALRTFLTERCRERYSRDAVRLAFLIALLWAIHPLQTASVTYVVQRCESMMGMFFLLTFYCVLRSDASAEYRITWGSLAVLSCALGMGCKQVMIAAPPLVLLYDRTFLSGSFFAAIKKRFLLYIGLFAACAVLLTSAKTITAGTTAGFALAGVTPYKYALTQCAVIPYYFRLAFWPYPQCLDYAWPLAETPHEVWSGIAFLGVLVLLTLIGTILNSAWGFLGAWFFLILAPTSSIMPIQDPIFEHRMYLSLAALAAILVVGVHGIARWLVAKRIHPRAVCASTAILFAALALALSVRTICRNCDYYSESTMWKKVVDMYPESQRATNNLGNALAGEGKHEESVKWFEESARLNPKYVDPQYNLGVELNLIGKKEEAIQHYKRTLELNPDYPGANGFLADILMDLDRVKEAIPYFEAEIRRDPSRNDLKEKLEDAREMLDSK